MKRDKQIGVGGIALDKEEKRYLNEVIESNRLSYGPMTKKFEQIFSNEHDCKYGVFCNSGTSALHIALAALKEKYGWSDGDEVIVPATTFIATSNIVIHNNMVPVFVDVDSRTYNINPSLIEEKITDKTKAMIPVHLFGMPADMDPIMEIAEKYNLKIIEDSCETMFARYKGKRVGSFGEIACFSTYIAHFLVTGIGGLCTTNDPDDFIMLRSLMNHGRDSIYLSIDDDRNITKEKLHETIDKRFKFVRLGHSFRATELEAAIGLGQFEKRESIIARRREIARKFIQGLNDLSDYIQLPFIPENVEHNFMMFPIVVRKESKTELIRFLEDNNIETRDMVPLLDQPVYEEIFNIKSSDYPVSDWILKSGFYIGSHQFISDEEIDYVIEKFHEFYN